MSNINIRAFAAAVLLLSGLTVVPSAFPQEETEYKKFKLEEASCDVGVRYKKTPQGIVLGVSAIATGRGSDFRKWGVSGIKLRIGGDRIRPDHESNFYVAEESYFRVPCAIVFAAIGFLGEYGGSDFNNTMSKIGVGLGMGLIALQAKGEITGGRCVFYIPQDTVNRIEEGKDNIEINISNEDRHLKETIRIGLIRPSGDTASKYNFKNMSQDDILKRMDLLKSEIGSLEQEQASHKYGQDPQYDLIQRRIETLETERGLAYKAWFERRNGPSD